MRRWVAAAGAVGAVLIAQAFSRDLALAAPVQADWRTFAGDAARSGWVDGATRITHSNVGSLRKRFVVRLGAVADSSPIYASHVKRSRHAAIAMLFVVDGAGTSYGIDAGSGAVLWRFPTHGPKITASSPVLDPDGRHLYVPGVDGRVHKLDAASGIEVKASGFPLLITRMPDVEKDASALNLANGFLYAVTSGYLGDAGPYVGHVVTVRLRDGQTHVLNTLCSNINRLLLDRSYDPNSAASCSSVRSGIWSRSGVVVDPDPKLRGRVYVATGNGPFDGKRNWGDSVLALNPDGSRIEDSFTPSDYAELENTDLDLGSTAPALLPPQAHSRAPLMAVQGGKSHVLYLLDRTHLGGVGGALSQFSLPYEMFSAPAVWRDAHGTTWIYLGFLPESHSVMGLTVQNDAGAKSRLHEAWSKEVGATSPVVANGIVFVAGDGALSALDAQTGALLWSSTRPSAGGTIGGIHWQSPIVAGDSVYVCDEEQHLIAYTLQR
ncbi:MAG: PQQ-binding-like beta-propeller repeat protein [Candidatus Eremiobacteraeota bacterium]|nr:PQQ-binding-like beta-propeller repeat protein [Candidatus Eremiobacteraeota bacterium]